MSPLFLPRDMILRMETPRPGEMARIRAPTLELLGLLIESRCAKMARAEPVRPAVAAPN
jgi:hypothetical protein